MGIQGELGRRPAAISASSAENKSFDFRNIRVQELPPVGNANLEGGERFRTDGYRGGCAYFASWVVFAISRRCSHSVSLA